MQPKKTQAAFSVALAVFVTMAYAWLITATEMILAQAIFNCAVVAVPWFIAVETVLGYVKED